MLKRFLVIMVFLLAWPLHASAAETQLTAIQVSKPDAKNIKIHFKLSEPIKPSVFSLSNPDRIVIDFKNTALKTQIKKLNFTKTDITAIRVGYPKPHTLRLVLDLKTPLRVSTFPRKPTKQVLLTLSKTQSDSLSSSSPILKKEAQRKFQKTITVVIDPGHGGKDPGAIGDLGTKEKDIVLLIAKKLANYINQQPNMRAILTRNGDYYVTLHNRLLKARKNKADLFIAIHADSHFNNHASGASVYSLSQHGATSIAARWLARRENYSELGDVDLEDLEDQSHLLRSVLIDLAQTQTTKDSLYWGQTILNSLQQVTKLHYSKVERAPFLVLKSPDIPSILVETGFISNSAEERRLRNQAYQHKIAQALFNGIRTFQTKYSETTITG